MMIRTENLGKKFGNRWVFQNLNFNFSSGEKVAITGGNGSGKSTLLKILSGALTPSKGKIIWTLEGKDLRPEDIFQYISFSAPYLQLIEELTVSELINFHFTFKKFRQKLTPENIIEIISLPASQGQFISTFSSGMKQKLKLGLAILSDVPLVLLDEPATNLDENAIEWFNNSLEKYCKNSTVVICSNFREEEIKFCDKKILLDSK